MTEVPRLDGLGEDHLHLVERGAVHAHGSRIDIRIHPPDTTRCTHRGPPARSRGAMITPGGDATAGRLHAMNAASVRASTSARPPTPGSAKDPGASPGKRCACRLQRERVPLYSFQSCQDPMRAHRARRAADSLDTGHSPGRSGRSTWMASQRHRRGPAGSAGGWKGGCSSRTFGLLLGHLPRGARARPVPAGACRARAHLPPGGARARGADRRGDRSHARGGPRAERSPRRLRAVSRAVRGGAKWVVVARAQLAQDRAAPPAPAAPAARLGEARADFGHLELLLAAELARVRGDCAARLPGRGAPRGDAAARAPPSG